MAVDLWLEPLHEDINHGDVEKLVLLCLLLLQHAGWQLRLSSSQIMAGLASLCSKLH
jgi:hypothetical protein